MKPKKGQFKFSSPIALSHDYTGNSDNVDINATHLGKPVGNMWLDYPDENGQRRVNSINIKKPYRGKGIGKAMWNLAKSEGMNPKHSTNQTESGKAWAKKVGD